MKPKIFSLILLVLIISFSATAQTVQKLAGTWEGVLNVGQELRIVFHIKLDNKGVLMASADSPDQSAYGLKCDTTFIKEDSLIIQMKNLRATYSGTLKNDSTLQGIFNQGIPLPLNLKKVEKASVKIKPQEPKPPFPYKNLDVVYENADKSLKYGATITIPNGNGPFPAAVLITGSGPQNRDEEIMGHKPFAVIADYLTRQGYIILRVDDRGVGKSSGDFSKATTADFAKDVNASVDYLLSRPEVDKNKLGLIGHSEGGMIAPMVVAERKDIDFVVLLAGPGVKIVDLMSEQNSAILRSMKVPENAIDVYRPFYKKLITKLGAINDTTEALNIARREMNEWAGKTDIKLLDQLDMDKEQSREEIAYANVQALSSPWFKYFLQFDPAPYLKKMKCKVLALNGDKDIQVIAQQNLPGIEKALKKARNKNFEIKQLPGLNHLFQTCKECTIVEYGMLDETFSPEVLKLISDWLIKNVKSK